VLARVAPRPSRFVAHTHPRQHGYRIHLHATNSVFHRTPMAVAVPVRHRQAIVEEADVGFAWLKHPPDGLTIVGGR
jgi:hypothetical protein